jgi:hypothetical protein
MNHAADAAVGQTSQRALDGEPVQLLMEVIFGSVGSTRDARTHGEDCDPFAHVGWLKKSAGGCG